MTKLTCSQLCDAAPELALGTLPGRQRAAALAHLDHCAECRLTVEGLSDAADALLLAAPEADPPAGFARRVADGFDAAPVRRRPRATARLVAVAAAVIAIAAIGLTAVAGPRATPAKSSFALQAPGVRTASFAPATGETVGGKVLASPDRPSWVFMTVHDEGSSEAYRCQLEVGDGRWIDVGTFKLDDGTGSWGKALPADLPPLKAVRLLDEQGVVAATASLA